MASRCSSGQLRRCFLPQPSTSTGAASSPPFSNSKAAFGVSAEAASALPPASSQTLPSASSSSLPGIMADLSHDRSHLALDGNACTTNNAARFKEPEEFLASMYVIEQQPLERPAEPPSQGQPARAQQRQPPKSKTPAEVYEDRLSKARWLARTVGSFYGLCRFLALCSLTWATVVLLGAFVPDLRFVDYVMVTSLLLLEAIRLATASFFTILLTQRLARRSQDPQAIIHGKDDHYQRAHVARLISTFLQALLIAPSFVCPIIRFHLIQYEHQNLHTSIFIFYLLILINASVSSIALFCSSAAFIYLKDRCDQSMLRYYDKLVRNAISTGVIQASDFGYFEFAYKMLGGEYARLVQPEAVVKNHRKLVEYLYRHRLGQDFLLIYLDADDAFVQQASVKPLQ